MEFKKLVEIIGDEPFFSTGLLLSGNVNPGFIRKQLSLWTASGKIWQLRRGLYCLAPPYQKILPHPFLVANYLQPGSYISRESALAFYEMIPEAVPITTSVTTRRPSIFHTPLGTFDYRHVQMNLFYGFKKLDIGNAQNAFIATREKALLDLIYLVPESDHSGFLEELRLQSLEELDFMQMESLVARTRKPRLLRALQELRRLAEEEKKGYKNL
jgi:predicted transcriptional regulator of viral defense system